MDTEAIEYTKKSSRIKNASRAIKRREAKILPIHMIKRDTHLLLNTNIETNKLIDTLLRSINFNSRYEELIRKINELIPHDIGYNYCISGSKAWYNIFKDYYENNLLSEYEKSAIHNNNTIDNYYFINNNNKEFIDEITTRIKSLLNLFISGIEAELNSNIKTILKDDNKQVQLLLSVNIKEYNILLFTKNTIMFNIQLKINDNVPKYKSAPTYNYAIHKPPQTQRDVIVPQVQQDVIAPQVPQTQQSPPAKQKRIVGKRLTQTEIYAEMQKEKSEIERSKKVAANSRADRAARLSLLREKKGGISIKNINKHILSFEVNFREKDDTFIENIDKIIIRDTHYLNIYGLFLFLQFAKNKYYIRPGKYNVFKIRDFIYNKLVLIDEYKTNALFEILDIYNITFKDFHELYKYVTKELNRLALTSNPDIEKFISETEENIINCLRPYINKTIVNINENIKSLIFKNNNKTTESGRNITGIFVAGGDAIRRYDFNGSLTKDIDSKIYIPSEYDINENINNYKNINKCINSNLFNLLSYLVIKKNNIFSSLEATKSKIFLQTEYNCRVTFQFISLTPNFLNFRFRQIPNNIFPVDLYSLDYRCKIIFEYKLPPSEEIKRYIYDYDIAFIDVVLESSTSNNYDKYAVLSNNLPISSLNFLIQDLINTYNEDTSSLLRFMSGKSDKDYERFKLLTKIAKREDKVFEINNDTKIIRYKKQEITDQNELLDVISDFTFDNDEEKIKYDKMVNIYNKNYKHDDKYRVKSKIIFNYEENTLMLRSGINGGSIRNLDNEITKIEKPKENDNYISKIMNAEYEPSLKFKEELFNRLISKK